MRVLRPAPDVLAFYDGRVPGARLVSAAPNWLDDGGYALGIASYAILSGDAALVYDTHLSPAHARVVRRTLSDAGVRRFTVVLSHGHLDHVAGNAAFADCEILAHPLTLEELRRDRATIERGDPPIDPLVLPTGVVADGATLRVGALSVTVRHFDIHSRDGLLLTLDDRGLLFAGDALEDPITYVDEPGRIGTHLAELDRLAALGCGRILPNHGAEARIAAGGFGPELIVATRRYLTQLLDCRTDPGLAAHPLAAFIAEDLASGAVEAFGPYAEVHAENVARVVAAAG